MFARLTIVAFISIMLGSLTFAAEPSKFVSLFDGRTLNGWLSEPNAYRVECGSIICVPGGKGNLLSKKEYEDFVLRFEFKLTAGANNGIGIRCPLQTTGNLHLTGIELQILDHNHEKYAALKPYQAHGSVYGLVPAKRDFLKPVGEWNQQEVTVQGRHIKVVLNGTTIVDADLDEALQKPLDGAEHPGAKRPRGHIGLLGHGDRVDVREIYIHDLKP